MPGGDPDQDDAAAAAQPDGELPDPLLVASVIVVADDVDDGGAVGGLQDGAGRWYGQGRGRLGSFNGGVAMGGIHAACGLETRCVEHWTTSRRLFSTVAAPTARARRGTRHDGHMIRISGRRVRVDRKSVV